MPQFYICHNNFAEQIGDFSAQLLVNFNQNLFAWDMFWAQLLLVNRAQGLILAHRDHGVYIQ